MNFEQLALQKFPHIAQTGTITRKEVNQVWAAHGTPYPNHIANRQNTVSRGVFKFNMDLPVNSITSVVEQPVVQPLVETDGEIDDRLNKTYRSLETLVDSVANGYTKSLIVAGAAGVGKSYTVRKQLEQHLSCNFTFVKGYTRPTGVFKLLYENRFPGQVLVLDDMDTALTEEVSLNLFKAALELSDTRRISWFSEKEMIDTDGLEIPKSFDYEGTVIFITNLDFNAMINKGNKLTPHLKALKTRSLYLDMGIKTNRELLVRINQVVKSSNILTKYGLIEIESQEIMEYLTINADKLDEISLRSVEKLAVLYLASPESWRDLADTTMLIA